MGFCSSLLFSYMFMGICGYYTVDGVDLSNFARRACGQNQLITKCNKLILVEGDSVGMWSKLLICRNLKTPQHRL